MLRSEDAVARLAGGHVEKVLVALNGPFVSPTVDVGLPLGLLDELLARAAALENLLGLVLTLSDASVVNAGDEGLNGRRDVADARRGDFFDAGVRA